MRTQLINEATADFPGRAAAIALLRQLRDGTITTDEFSDHWPRGRDPALKTIHWAIWSTYDDRHAYRLSGAQSLDSRQIAGYNRCILFLASDLSIVPAPTGLRRLLARIRRQKIVPQGPPCDSPVWPFASSEAYREFLLRLNKEEAQSKGIAPEYDSCLQELTR
jgi:hypothetical protein